MLGVGLIATHAPLRSLGANRAAIMLLSAACGISLTLPPVVAAEQNAAPDVAAGPFAGVEEFIVYGGGVSRMVFTTEAIEMQVLDRLEIEAAPNLSVADAVSKLPGIRTTQRIQGERAAVSIEGLPPEYTKILVNGQRYTGFVGSVADLEDVPLTNLDQLEIQRGPQGLRHGPDAGGGVINIQTVSAPEQGFRADVWGLAGSDRKALLAATLGAAIGDHGTTLSFTHDQIAGYEPRGSDAVFVNVGGSDSLRRVDDLYASTEFARESNLRGFVRFGFRKEEERYVGGDGVAIGNSDVERWLGSVSAAWEPNLDTSFHAAITYYEADAINDIARRSEIVDREVRGQVEASRSLEFGQFGLDFTLGVDVRQLQYSLDEAPLGFIPTAEQVALSGDRSIRKHATTGGGYLALDLELSHWATLIAGARLQIDTRYDAQAAPQVALVLSPAHWLKIRLQYGRSDRYPSLNDLHQPVVAQSGGVYFLAGNPELEPEKTDSFRAGFELALGQSITLSATGFWNEIDGLIRHFYDQSIQTGTEPISFGGPPVPIWCPPNPPPSLLDCSPLEVVINSPVTSDLFRKQNLEYVRTRGVETQLFWKPARWFAFRAGYTFMDTKIESDTIPDLVELPNEPAHTVDLEARWTAQPPLRWLDEAQLSGVARYRSTALRETSGTGLAGFTSTEHTNSSWVVDLRAKLLIADLFTLNFDIRNVTNERTVDSNEIRGRTFYGGVRISWPRDSST